MSWNRIKADLTILFFGHILNPLLWKRSRRSRKRVGIVRMAVDRYLDAYVPVIASIEEDAENVQDGPERIFSIWLQGEENAPEIVKACFRSIRHNCVQELVVLDEHTVGEWIELPEYILKKRSEGKIKPAHFADICRVALLYKYGGIWLDATAFVVSPIPEWVMNEDFFIYLSGNSLGGHYAFVQNCFFRARKNNYIVKVWMNAIFEYWRRENSVIDYFMHQMIFRKVVECNPVAKAYFEKMPHVIQDPTHELWWKYRDEPFDKKLFDRITASAVFQKTEYKSVSAKEPVPGSFADAMMKMYR